MHSFLISCKRTTFIQNQYNYLWRLGLQKQYMRNQAYVNNKLSKQNSVFINIFFYESHTKYIKFNTPKNGHTNQKNQTQPNLDTQPILPIIF